MSAIEIVMLAAATVITTPMSLLVCARIWQVTHQTPRDELVVSAWSDVNAWEVEVGCEPTAMAS